MCRVVGFDTAVQFWTVWNRFQAGNYLPSVLFARGRDVPRTVVKRDGRVSSVDGVGLFRDGCPPDTKARRPDGSSVHVKRVTHMLTFRGNPEESLDDVYEAVVLLLIGETLSAGGVVNGVFLSDKTKPGATAVRLELWCNTDDATALRDMKQRLQEGVRDAAGLALDLDVAQDGARLRFK